MREYRNNVNRIIQDSKIYARRSKLADIYLKLLALSSLLFALLMLSWIFYTEHSSGGPYIDNSVEAQNGETKCQVFHPTTCITVPITEQHTSIGGEPAPNSPAGRDLFAI
jgi:hypothetical protein